MAVRLIVEGDLPGFQALGVPLTPYLFMEACYAGHPSVINFFLDDPTIDPTVEEQLCLRMACRDRQMGLVRRLLSRPGVKVSARNHEALWWAIDNRDLPLIDLLLQHGADPSVNDNEMLRRADPQIINTFVRDAIQRDRQPIIDSLLKNPLCLRGLYRSPIDKYQPLIDRMMAIEASYLGQNCQLTVESCLGAPTLKARAFVSLVHYPIPL